MTAFDTLKAKLSSHSYLHCPGVTEKCSPTPTPVILKSDASFYKSSLIGQEVPSAIGHVC